MKNELKMVTVVLAASAVLCAAAASASAGFSRGGAFKAPGYGARAWGMGGAAVATVDDEGSVYWNPGMMVAAPANAIGASYINLLPQATARQSQLAYVHLFGTHDTGESGPRVARHAVGVMYTNLRLGIQTGESYDENVFRIAYAYSPDPLVGFGLAWDIFASSSQVGGFGSRGTSVDAAIRLLLTENATIGVVARNAFSRYSYDDGSDYQREREFVLALSSRSVRFLTVEGDLVWAHGGASRWIIGAESDYMFDVLALRAGIAAIETGESRTVPYFGFSAHFRRFALHYNANMDADNAFAETHRFTLSVAL